MIHDVNDLLANRGDGRDKPGHDGNGAVISALRLRRARHDLGRDGSSGKRPGDPEAEHFL